MLPNDDLLIKQSAEEKTGSGSGNNRVHEKPLQTTSITKRRTHTRTHLHEADLLVDVQLLLVGRGFGCGLR